MCKYLIPLTNILWKILLFFCNITVKKKSQYFWVQIKTLDVDAFTLSLSLSLPFTLRRRDLNSWKEIEDINSSPRFV